MCAIVRVQLGKNTLNVIFYRVLCYRQLGSYDFIWPSTRDAAQYLYLSVAQNIINGMFGHLLSNLLRNSSSSSVNQADRVYQLGSQGVFKEEADSARPKCACRANVARSCRQHNNAGMRKPGTVTRYLANTRQTRKSAPNGLSAIATFFGWAIAEGRFSAGNPVVPRIHKRTRQKRAPRPLSPGDRAKAHEMLATYGDLQLQFAGSAAEEGGLQIGEIVTPIAARKPPISIGLFSPQGQKVCSMTICS
jgi:hypothetical protein